VDRRALPPITADGREPGDSRPETQTEEVLAQIWGEILGLKNVGVEADFFDLGGHSLLALKLFTRIRQQFDLDMPISTLFQNPTVRDLAQVLDTRLGQVALPALAAPAAQPHGATAPGIEDAEWDTTTIISAGPGSGRRPIFVVGGVGGNVNNLYHLGGLIGQARPVIGFQTRGILGHRPHDRIETMATENIRYMRQRQAKGPYLIAGYSGGALTAFEMARQLVAEGEEVRHIFVLDTYAPGFAANFSPKVNLGLKARLADELDWLREQPLGEQIERLRLIARKRLVRGPILAALKRLDPTFYRIETTRRLWLAAAARYTGGPLDCQMTLFRSEPGNRRQRAVTESAPLLGWDKMIPLAKISVVHLPGDHNSMLLSRGAEIIAEKIESRATG
jgi:thioesterase domain-containing protein/acyl carrier protein